MAGELHDISVAIGRIQAALEDGQRSREMMRHDLKSVGQKVEALSHQLTEVVAQIEALAERQSRVEPQVDQLAATRQKALGFLGGVTLLAGSAGAAATEIIRKVFP